ncbi:MAG TPA: tol-pal system protein YbgF [Gammaproteobacteria bacterium]|nr:tol-pal system protein YbgF [Gammaproteobacteria bacterium]HIB74624.1 tol-pal system protein YbgF [Gammaproteobacteria bacterium]HIM22432.1 tol-pal system protein YbgF [Gammaproteobacteria bacterium]HIO04071.1 tol-pal system protein YbgF [Gammaproteobacteria bacterium]
MKKSLFLFFLFILAFPLRFFSEEEESLDLIYLKIRALEQEIATLRNLIEENTYLIERYQELQQQRYLDLDKRLHSLLSGELEELNEQSLNLNDLNSTEEIDLYKEALELFEVSRYAEAIEVFRDLIISFPEGSYSADAYFWSGELYLAQEQLEDAREHYLVVAEKFKDHDRVADCLYKLGVIEKVLLNNEAANSYFSRLISEYPDTGAAELAKKSMETSIQESN